MSKPGASESVCEKGPVGKSKQDGEEANLGGGQTGAGRMWDGLDPVLLTCARFYPIQ